MRNKARAQSIQEVLPTASGKGTIQMSVPEANGKSKQPNLACLKKKNPWAKRVGKIERIMNDQRASNMKGLAVSMTSMMMGGREESTETTEIPKKREP